MKRWQFLLLGLMVGVGLGLLIGWILLPVRYYDTTPANLSPVYRDEYIQLVAQTYAVDRDIQAARARLERLDVDQPLVRVQSLYRRLSEEAPQAPIVTALAELINALEQTVSLPTISEEDLP